jgi:hypothetical protein
VNAGVSVTDSAGDLFGNTFGSGPFGDGTIFEIPFTNGSFVSAPVTIAAFDDTNGALPSEPIADSDGDLFGSTELGGTNNDGTAFELVNNGGGSYTLNTLFSFDGTNGEFPMLGLFADAAGDLFGTTTKGGTYGYGTVFEIAKTEGGYASTPTTLVSFDSTNGDYPLTGLMFDSAGNIFGSTEEGGAYGSLSAPGEGTVFEIAKTAGGYATTPTTLVSFNYTDGEFPVGELVADAAGGPFRRNSEWWGIPRRHGV